MQLTPEQYFIVLLLIVLGEYLLTTFVDLLNLGKDKGSVPDKLKAFLSDDKYQTAIAYQKENSYFGLFSGLISILTLAGAFAFELFGYLDNWLRPMFESPLWMSLAFFGVIFLINSLIQIPFQLYATFVIEENYGFNTTSVKTFITDKIKEFFLTVVVGGLLLGLLFWLIMSLGKDFWWIFWLVAGIFMIGINFFYTSLIVPLFNKLTPLEDGELKNEIIAFSEKVAFPINNIYVINGSQRSKKANAYFSGFGNRKKIVLYDTLVNNYSREELVAILAHEIGHYKKRHTFTGMLIGLLQLGVMFFVMSHMIFDPNLSIALGAEVLSFPVNLIAFGIIYSPVSMVLGLFGNYLSRKHEYEADHYAASNYQAQPLKNGLIKLSIDSMSNLRPHSWYIFFHYSHPPLLKRLEAIETSE